MFSRFSFVSLVCSVVDQDACNLRVELAGSRQPAIALPQDCVKSPFFSLRDNFWKIVRCCPFTGKPSTDRYPADTTKGLHNADFHRTTKNHLRWRSKHCRFDSNDNRSQQLPPAPLSFDNGDPLPSRNTAVLLKHHKIRLLRASVPSDDQEVPNNQSAVPNSH